jgi:hypothetical protein
MLARKAGMSVVAISWDQSLKSEASPIPTTVRFHQELGLGAPPGIDFGPGMTLILYHMLDRVSTGGRASRLRIQACKPATRDAMLLTAMGSAVPAMGKTARGRSSVLMTPAGAREHGKESA